MQVKLSADQEQALNSILDWYLNYSKDKQYYSLGGYAGTGKSTLIAFFRKKLDEIVTKLKESGHRDEDYEISVAFCTYTGKAAQVLKSKIKENKAVYKTDSYSTIHSLIYSPMTNDNEEIVGWERKDNIGKKLIIVDEASMVDQKIWQDLLKYKVPILAVGDHGQLPPIAGNFNLMEEPDYKLEKIHRQVEGNPIIELSKAARETGNIPEGDYDSSVMKVLKTDFRAREIVDDVITSFNSDTLILCGFNNTRIRLNKSVRQAKEIYSEEPTVGDRVICLKNNHTKQIFNGMLGEISKIEEHDKDKYYLEAILDDNARLYKGLVLKEQFGEKKTLNPHEIKIDMKDTDLFDFGYAMTVHKAQGSQANTVLLIEERFQQMDDLDWKRWLYTAVTRATTQLYIIGS